MRAFLLVALFAAIVAPAASATTIPWSGPGGLAVSPDGRNVYATGGRTLTLARDPASGLLTELDATSPFGSVVATSPDGRWVYIGYGGTYNGAGGIHILARDPASGLLTHIRTYTGALGTPTVGAVTGIAISPDGAELYVSQVHDTAILAFRRDADTGDLTYLQALFGGPSDLAYLGYPWDLTMSPDGRSLYVAGGEYVSSFSRDQATGTLTAGGAAGGAAGWRLAVSPDGRRVYAGGPDYTAYDRDADTGALAQAERTNFAGDCAGPCYPGGPIAISPDSASIFSSQLGQNSLQQATATSGGATLAHTYSDGADGFDGLTAIAGLAWSPDGRFLYLATGRYEPSSVLTLAWDGSRLRQVARLDPTMKQWNDGYPAGVTPGVSIAGGAIYVNDPQVALKVVPPMWGPSSLRISNDGGLGTSEVRRVDASRLYMWHLDLGDTRDRSVKHVYVRFTSDGMHAAETFSDDVILDQIAPQVLSARVRASRLTIKAHDNRSGVRKLQLTSSRAHPPAPRRFAKTVKLSHVPKRLWVRVIDGAGNTSRWRGAKR
jgi:DNA-binding beta-propeller fold protein YncE